MTKGTAFLMYHELQATGRELCESDPGYVRYAVTQDDFLDHLTALKVAGWNGWSVSEALTANDETGNSQKGVCFTFDDGCATDLLIAAPILKEKGFNATFYITVNHLGARGYLTSAQLRELSGLGFEIGSHSMTHRYLNDLSESDLIVEIRESKRRLEDIIGKRIVHFSCPGGRINSTAKKIAVDAGYQSVSTSRIGLNTRDTDRFALTRVAVKRGVNALKVEAFCRGEGLFLTHAREAVLSATKLLLGNSMYERVRSGMLRQT